MKTIVWFVLVLSALSAADELVHGIPGQKVTIKCGFDTYSSRLDWHRGEKFIMNIDSKTGFRRKGSGDIVERSSIKNTNLEISRVKEEDAGEFTCTVDRKSRKHRLLVMSVSVRPSSELQLGSNATFTCQTKGLESDTLGKWKMPGQDESTGRHTFELNSVAPSHEGTWVCMYSHAGNEYSKELEIKVIGLPTTTSPPKTSNDTCVPTSTSSNASGPLRLSWWMWVAVGVGGVVVVFLMVLVIILCKRIKRRKKRLLKIKNAAQSLKPRQYCQCDHPAAAAKPQQGRRREKPC